MKRIKLTVAYDGTAFSGWQSQPEQRTVEGVINEALSRLTGEKIAVIGASRTDAGVHALGNVAVFDTASKIPAERFCYALNPLLPEDVVAVRSELVASDWHPRHQECRKTYEYRIQNAEMPDPTRRRTSCFVSFPLDIEAMRKAAEYLKGTHDFASFCCVRTNVKDTVRTIYRLELERQADEIRLTVEGNGFLYNMVRIIAGTLLQVGRGYFQPEQVKEMLEAKNRIEAGATAPPQGLRLVRIDYEEERKEEGHK